MQKIVSLCKRRGFVFQSSEIYGGLRSAYDFGPLGVELKRNLMNHWWRFMVLSREDVVGLDASILMHPRVWEASGHLAGFSDPLVDCLVCKERFRADQAPTAAPGADLVMTFADKSRAKVALEIVNGLEGGAAATRDKKDIKGVQAGDRGYVCPVCGSPFLSAERQFNLMFKTSIGAVDPMGEIVAAVERGELEGLKGAALRAKLDALTKESAVYLRPETAQAMFVQFQNIQQSMAMKIPFGIAQMGKSFRNEITVEHFIFRSVEFEQMEMEFFCEPEKDDEWLDYWKEARLAWWRSLANEPDKFKLRAHEGKELAHYAKACYDIEYEYPWGWGELEGVANRTNYDLKKHAQHSGAKAEYFDPITRAKFVPHVIEPAAGATRGVLVYLIDAYNEETVTDAKGNEDTRVVLKLHPLLAPIKVAVLPLVKKDGMPEKARAVVSAFFNRGINAKYDEQHAIGRRYRRHDEIGTPWCLTIDGQTLEDDTITIRERDTMAQRRIPIAEAVAEIERLLRGE
ncbi:glycine--tRNA ligase [Myxococcota bacterium]|nr:glycine--tRNA ligase [Myxococcota bacterium]MBU1898711.1 glycine--tRNA ligase [Myxococcota bacterium]